MRLVLLSTLLAGCAGGAGPGGDYVDVDGSYAGEIRLIFTFHDRPPEDQRVECAGTVSVTYEQGLGDGAISCTFDGIMTGTAGAATLSASLRPQDAAAGGVNGEIAFEIVTLPLANNVDEGRAIGAVVIDATVVGIFGEAQVAGGYNVPES